MSKLSDLKGRLRTLEEIRSILNAMKNLSIVEMNKVVHLEPSQKEMARSIQTALEDFERSFDVPVPQALPSEGGFYVLLGSERGFCGPFNEAVIERLEAESSRSAGPSRILAVGRKLALKLEGDPRLFVALDGPSTAEEIPGVISDLAGRLAKIGGPGWTIIHHEGEGAQEKTAAVDPFSRPAAGGGMGFAYPPLLNLSPEDLYPELLEQYLFSVLYRAFYLSFLEENRQRLQHMEGALDTLESHLGSLRRAGNALRQEEITEELEVILLGVGEEVSPVPGIRIKK